MNDLMNVYLSVIVMTCKLLTSLCDLRGTHQFPHINKLDQGVGMAIQKMGPRYERHVINSVTLTLTLTGNPLNCH